MPAPSSPPPQDEAGAILSPRQLSRWLDVNPVSPLTRTQTYLVVPAFELSSEWLGYSNLIGAFNFTGTRNFTLPPHTAPTNPNYVLCIAWIDENNDMHRYKLWDHAGAVFYFPLPLYTGQLIKKNFRFEVWDVLPPAVNFDTVTLAGAGTAGANQEYVSDGLGTWAGQTDALFNLTVSGNGWLVNENFSTHYASLDTPPDYPPMLGWEVVSGAAPAPYGTVNTSSIQLTDLTFYTSVRGNFDYQWQTDSALSIASSIITDFNIANNNAPWTAPADSVSTINN